MHSEGDRGNWDFSNLVKLFMASWNSLPVSQEYITLGVDSKVFS